jgi:hypothetical protein
MRNWSAGSMFRVVVLVLLAFGVPSVAAWQFAHQISQHPWWALGLAVLYELLLAVGSFAVAVWQGLRTRWIERTTDWLNVRLRWRFAGYRRRYRAYLWQQYHDFDVTSLLTLGSASLELEQVYVELGLAPQTPQQASSHLLLSHIGNEGPQHPLWQKLASRMNESWS